MSRRIPDDQFNMAQKKLKSRQLLAERYYGKKALQDTYTELGIPSNNYLRDLKRRVRGHHNDMIYRGALDDDPQ